MCKITIIEPNISKEENEENLKILEKVLQKIALQIIQRIHKEEQKNVIPEGCGITLIKRCTKRF